jgi:deoxycytidylate deaminase
MNDRKWHTWTQRLAKESKCIKRQVGCVLISPTGNLLGLGYNRTPNGIEDCMSCRRADSPSGKDLEKCPAIHAEVVCILDALNHNASIGGSTLYTSSIIPCKNCLGIILDMNIREIVVASLDYYDDLSKELIGWISPRVLGVREVDI